MSKFDLTSLEKRAWYLKVFRNNLPLVDIYRDKWTLTAEGMSAAIDYLNLKLAQERAEEAQKSADEARRIAYCSIGIGVVVGVVQIILSIYQICYT